MHASTKLKSLPEYSPDWDTTEAGSTPQSPVKRCVFNSLAQYCIDSSQQAWWSASWLTYESISQVSDSLYGLTII